MASRSHPARRVGYWERGPASDVQLTFGGTWSAYWYNGHVYSCDQKGFDVLEIDEESIPGAKSRRVNQLNAQTQYAYRTDRRRQRARPPHGAGPVRVPTR
ncbi:hypothetical protein [Micromonospora thermarum]|uniref:Uncharacterized protein n=1 Tax=Micromonospora thermarum TaxID=2720024 RepID=A0ABX0ZGI4_9ACTN|nr:hypothetical protein [Micromonospora thermarum]NJP35151.1 hypothetical protein [Micromonospora thermarum]